eukprot:Rhum_TRINITY_DN14824_c16_g1::Rhum_TRINITY_DN14824_c16_g1_i1::g.119499::m.119499
MAKDAANVLAVIDVVADEEETPMKGVAVTVLARTTGEVLHETSVQLGSERGAVGAMLEAVDAELKPFAKVTVVCDGPRLFRKEIHQKHRTKLHWERYIDLEREVERTCKEKCRGLLGVMLTVGLEPEVASPGLEKNRLIAKVIRALMAKGNKFDRPMRIKAATAEEKAEERASRKRKREAYEAVERRAEEEAQAEAEAEGPPPVPSLHMLKQAVFLSGTARRVGDLMAQYGSRVADLAADGCVVTVSPQCSYDGGAPWLAVAATHAVRTLLNGKQAGGRGLLLCVPSLTAALEASAALGDLKVNSLLYAGTLQVSKTAATTLPATAPAVLVTTRALLEEALANTANFEARQAVVVADPEDAAEAATAVTKASKAKVCVLATGLVEGGKHEVPVPVPNLQENGEELDADAAAPTLSGLTDLEEALTGDRIHVNQSVLSYASGAAANLPKVAECLKQISEAKKHVGPSVTLLCYYALAATPSPFTEPEESVCALLQQYHLMLARLMMEVDLLVDEVKPNRQGVLNEMASAILEMPLLPAKGDAQKEATKGPGVLAGDEVMATALLGCVQAQITDAQIDGLADLWSVRVVHDTPKTAETHALKLGRKLGRHAAFVEAALTSRLDGLQLGVPVATIHEETSFALYKHRFGPLQRFLHRCKGFVADNLDGQVSVSVASGAAKEVSARPVPLCGRKQLEQQKMEKEAIEEILTVLPRGLRPCVLSSIGVSICSWNRFNNRYQGLLGPTMLGFLLRRPDAFVVNGRTVRRADVKTSPEYDTGLLKHGGRDGMVGDESVRNQKSRRKGSRADRIHSVISQKYQKKAIRKNNLKSAKIQKIPGFGQKKSKYKGKGTTPHWMK